MVTAPEDKQEFRAIAALVILHAMISAAKPFTREELAKQAWQQADALIKAEGA
jgi:hypothetical protein